MPKTEQSKKKEKVIVNYTQAPILADLEFPELLKEFRRLKHEEEAAEKIADKWNAKRRLVGLEIQSALEAVAADSVDYNSGKLQWRATLVKGEPTTQTNEDKLKENLMKIGKLDAALIAKIFAASQDDVQAKKPYVLVTVQE